jgi:mitochondrial fission protein ELM1
MPYGPADPRDDVIMNRPFPDILIASGRRAVPYLRKIRRLSCGRTFCVFLKDPRTGPSTADLIWAPEHDAVRGPNVLVSPTSPHCFPPQQIAMQREKLVPEIMALPHPRTTVLLGGTTKAYRYDNTALTRLKGHLQAAAKAGGGFMLSSSRRTEASLMATALAAIDGCPQIVWEGSGEKNPYANFLAGADAFVITADSTNMLSEATTTGRPIFYFEGTGGSKKIRHMLHNLTAAGVAQPFVGDLAAPSYQPIDVTMQIAEAIKAGLARAELNDIYRS